MDRIDIVLRKLNGGLVELVLPHCGVKLSTPDELAEGSIVREVRLILDVRAECRVLFGDAGIGIARYSPAGEIEWFKEGQANG